MRIALAKPGSGRHCSRRQLNKIVAGSHSEREWHESHSGTADPGDRWGGISWQNKCVTALENHGPAHIIAPRSAEFDLRERDAIERLFDDAQPEIVIHLAAVVGGIGANRAESRTVFLRERDHGHSAYGGGTPP